MNSHNTLRFSKLVAGTLAAVSFVLVATVLARAAFGPMVGLAVSWGPLWIVAGYIAVRRAHPM